MTYMSNKISKELLIASGKLNREKVFWAEKLGGELAKVSFPYDNNVMSSTGVMINTYIFHFTERINNKLDQLSSSSMMNLFLVLHTGIQALLYRYTGADDIITAVPIGKQAADKELLNKIIPVRSSIRGDMTFKELLIETKKGLNEAVANQNYPIDLLLEKLKTPINDCMRSPLQVAAMLDNIHDEAYIKEANASMLFIFSKEGNDLSCRINYISELYSEASVHRIANHFKQLLEKVLFNIDTKLSEIEVLTEEEVHELLYSFNDTAENYTYDKTIHKLFEEQVLKAPDNIAVACKNEMLTYDQLNKKANQLARLLLAKGAGIGSIIGIMVEPSLEMLVGIMAILKAGAAYLPIDTAYPADRIEYMLDDSKAAFMLTQKHLLSMVDFMGEQIAIDDEEQYIGESSNLDLKSQPEDLAYIIFTSGSTGRPKGVMVEHKSLVNLTQWHNQVYKVSDKDRAAKYAGFSFDASVWEIFPYVTAGAALYMIPEEIRLDTIKLNRYFEDNSITISFLPTQICEQFMRLDNKSLRVLLAGGDKLKYYEQKSYKLFNNYGPTENTVVTTYFEVNGEYTNIPIGKPVANTQIYIVDKYNRLQPIGAPGELCISGRSLARGYLNKPELTAEKFVDNPFREGERMYRTGDLARWLSDGNIEFLGRLDYQVKIRGFRIELGEIESRLLSYDGVKEAVVIDREGNDGNKYICGYITAAKTIDLEALKRHLAEELPEYMIPAYIKQLEAIPMTQNGKVDRRSLPEPTSIVAEKEYVAPESEIEEKLCQLWKEVLGIERVGINDSFFELGGHSLKATTLVAKIHKIFDVEVHLMEIFKSPTIKALASYIEASEASIYSSIQVEEASVGYSTAHYPLSSAQKRIYTLQQLEGSGTSYNIPIIVAIEGRLDRLRLESAFKRLVERHEGLRTSFRLINGEPVQVINEEVEFVIDAIEADEADIRELAEGFVKAFDLDKEPLFRSRLVRLAEDKHILMLDIHHIISDGTSMAILIDEFAKLYNGDQLPHLKLQYKDYSIWQNKLYSTDKLKKQEEYWLSLLSGDIPVVSLPTDYPRPSIQSFDGDLIRFEIDKALSIKIKKAAENTGATLYMILLAAFNVLLARYSSQEDILVGSPIAGRPHADLQSIMGMFVNTLAMRNYPTGDKSFREFLMEVKENSIKAYENQDYQFEELVEKLNIPRDMSRNPLFDVMFSMQNIEMRKMDLGELRLTPCSIEGRRAKFDVSLTAAETEDSIGLSLEYSTKLFCKETIERLIKHYVNILEEVTDCMDKKLKELDIITAEERYQLLIDFNATEKEFNKEKTLHQLFEEQAAKTPDNPALIFGNKQLTYRELDEKANKLAQFFESRGVTEGSIVGIILERSMEMLVSIMAVLKSGAAYLPIDSEYPESRIEYMLEDSGAVMLITQQKHIDKISINIEKLLLEDIDSLAYAALPLAKGRPEDLAYIIYTSGSTGKPKGVMIEHCSVVNLIQSQLDEFSIDENDRIMQFSTICFDASVEQIFIALLSGAALVLVEKEKLLNIEEFEEYLIEKRVTHLHAVPLFLSRVGRRAGYSLKRVIAGGDTCPVDLIDKWYKHCDFYNEYGPTETTVTSIEMRVKETTDKNTIGRPIANTKLYILDKHNRPQPVGVPGELCIAGAGVARGYLNRPELTDEKFVNNPFGSFDEAIAKMYRTGDLARWLPNGCIEFLGRIDHQVKIRGFRIELGEIEGRLLGCDGVKDAVVLAKEDKEGNKYLCAYVTTENEIDIQGLREQLVKVLPDYMIPAYFIWLDSMPLTPSGKLNRKLLPEPNGHPANNKEYVEPRNEIEEALASIWMDILGIAKVSINDSFFELGGHSLKAVSLASRIRDVFETNISVGEIFLKPTIEAQAALLISSKKDSSIKSDESFVMLKRSENPQKNIFIVHDGTGQVDGYLDMITHINDHTDCWGIIYEGLEGIAPENISVEELAAGYIQKLRLVQPEGPYNILGWSAGGSIVFEMARQLQNSNEAVAELVIIDSPAPKKRRLSTFLGIAEAPEFKASTEIKLIEELTGSTEIIRRLKKLNNIAEIWDTCITFLEADEKVYESFKQGLSKLAHAVASFEIIEPKDLILKLNTTRTLNNAIQKYSPESAVSCSIKLIKATDSDIVSLAEWKRCCSADLKYIEINGSHFSIMQKLNAGEVAAASNIK